MASAPKAWQMHAFAAGAVLSMAIRESAKRHNLSISQFIRAALLGNIVLDLPEGVRAKAAQEAEALARHRGGGRRPRNNDTD